MDGRRCGRRCNYEMSCLLMLYDMNCTDCNITRLSSTTMGKMMLGHNGVRGSRDYEERVADVESKQEYHPEHRKTYPLRKRMHGQPGNYSSPGIVQQLGETPADGVSPAQAIVEQWDYQGHQDQLQGEAAQADRSEDTGKENARLDSVAPHAAESRPRRLASLNAEAVNNLLLEREDCPSNRRCRKGPSCGVECTENRPDCRTGYPMKRRIGSSSSSFDGDVFTCAGSEPAPAMDGWESGFAELPAKKRMASLNAAAFLKLSNTRDVSAGRRSRTDGESKPGKVTGGTRHSCPQPLAGRRCPRAKRKDFRSDIETKLAPGTDLGDSEGQHKEESVSTGQHSTLPVNVDVPCPYMDKTNGYFHRLSILMGSQAMIRPKYQALEESNASGAEFTQSVAPFQSHSLTLLDNFVSDPDHYEFLPPEVCLDSPVDDLYLHYDRSNLLPIGCNSTHGCPMCSAAFSCCTPPDDEGNLLISQSALPSGIPYSHAPCGGSLCVGDTTTVQCIGMNGYDLCRVRHPSLNRDVVRRTLTSDQASCLLELGTKADGYSSLKPLSVTIPVTSHPVSPANPVSGCPVPTAPPAAEPVPHLQRPGLETPATSRPQTLSMLKLSKECPQSSKPPSSSKSNLRSPASSPAQQSKAGTGHVESKQQRISRRRATNGWLPVGEPYDKPVYVVGEVELLIRKCYPAVERDGEVIKVRDTVLLKSGPRKKSIPYVAKVSALWEDPASE
ncbi:bromo adjacent homology domain-containing 1 protein isoform X5 [Stegostoma tigrinum]|uniref:bromo adjacent homology domain-containing 1 protein isoform X5 n=1 Tax=Stegostoma tigrinum TaxID=3053191 RepID=UPI002870144A|nr:bromo adjacent homology domain-containing 1 protein isoform X5 [Stegostoma tigrinum]